MDVSARDFFTLLNWSCSGYADIVKGTGGELSGWSSRKGITFRLVDTQRGRSTKFEAGHDARGIYKIIGMNMSTSQRETTRTLWMRRERA
jgi:hypothetical protein